MLTLFFSPHMQSVDNAAGRASGHANVPLTAEGRTKARELGGHYRDTRVDRVFSSDLARARETALLAFQGRGAPVEQDRRLRECDYGELTQSPVGKVDRRQHIFDPFPGGESMEAVATRTGSFLMEVVEGCAGLSIVVIGHGATKPSLDYWTGNRPLNEVVLEPVEWLEVPIWRYEVVKRDLEARQRAGSHGNL